MKREQRESRLEQQAREHEEMRARLRKTTDTAVACLTELREQHRHEGHFIKGMFVEGRAGK